MTSVELIRAYTDFTFQTATLQPRLRIPAARCARVVPKPFAPKRAQGKPGARCTRGLVCKSAQKNAHEHTGPAEAIRLSLRGGLRLISCSPRRSGFLVTVASRILA